MAAERLAGLGAQVHLFERMPSVGRKFLMAGRGGLNLSHSELLPALLQRYGEAEAWLTPVILAWPPDALRAWCTGLGQECFTGSSGRLFPAGFKASPLLRAWLQRLRTLGVKLHTRQSWLGWDEAGRLRFAHQPPFAADAAVLALGGASWPRLGSDGSWVPVLEAMGAGVAPLRPANSGIIHTWSDWFAGRFQGQPLKRVRVACDGHSSSGEAVVTASGLEGGAIYALSRAVRRHMDRDGGATLTIDLRPDLSIQALSQKLAGQGQSMANALRRAGLSPVAAGLVRELGGGGGLPERIKAAELRLEGVGGLDRAISTAGGVMLSAIDDHLMLRARPGVFVAGEMIDWDAPTGGYLLQACLSTGWFVGGQVMTWLDHRQPGL